MSGSISFSRLLMGITGSPEAVCSMSAICFLRRASKNFSPTLDGQQDEREDDDERDHRCDRH